MKLLRLFAVFAFYLCLTFTVHADIKIGVIDDQKVEEESVAFKDAKAKIDLRVQEYQRNASKTAERFKTIDTNLEKQKNVLSPEEYNKKWEEFRKETEKEEKNFYDQRVAIGKAEQKAAEVLSVTTRSITEKIAKEKGVMVVLSKNVTVYDNESINITNEVILELNKQLKSIDVNLS
jgi:outer membrane protein